MSPAHIIDPAPAHDDVVEDDIDGEIPCAPCIPRKLGDRRRVLGRIDQQRDGHAREPRQALCRPLRRERELQQRCDHHRHERCGCLLRRRMRDVPRRDGDEAEPERGVADRPDAPPTEGARERGEHWQPRVGPIEPDHRPDVKPDAAMDRQPDPAAVGDVQDVHAVRAPHDEAAVEELLRARAGDPCDVRVRGQDGEEEDADADRERDEEDEDESGAEAALGC